VSSGSGRTLRRETSTTSPARSRNRSVLVLTATTCHGCRRPGREQHGGRTTAGVFVRVAQRLLARTAALWHNDHTEQLLKRSLLAYDH
jgi:hypothetical protein